MSKKVNAELKEFVNVMGAYLERGEVFHSTKDVFFVLENAPRIIAQLKDFVCELEESENKVKRTDDAQSASHILNRVKEWNSHMPELKTSFHKVVSNDLKKLAEKLGLREFSVTTNPGGPAVLGETYLMGMLTDKKGVYVCLGGSNFVRSVTSMKDYNGGENINVGDGGRFAGSQYMKNVERACMSVLVRKAA